MIPNQTKPENFMSAPPASLLGLASVHGATISDIVVEKRPRTGRGKKLTLAQENVLKRLYEQKRPSLPAGEVPVKSFWVGLAGHFYRLTGREYSWQSAKRNIMGSMKEGQPSVARPQTLPAETFDNETPVAAHSPQIVTALPQNQQYGHGRSQSPEKRDPTPISPPSPHSPACYELEKSPPVVGRWTQRALFPNARKSNQKTDYIPTATGLSRSRRRSRSPLDPHPVYRRRSPVSNNRTEGVSKMLPHHLGSVPYRASLSISKPSPPPSRVSNSRSEKKPFLDKNCSQIMNRRYNLPDGEVRGHSTDGQKRQESVTENLDDSPNLSDSDELPETPAQISRRGRFINKVEP